MHDQIVQYALNEDAPPVAVSVAPGSVNTVRQLDGTDSGERDIDLAMSISHAAQDILNAFTAPLAFDENAGIQDQAQGISPRRKYREAYGCE